MKILLSVFIFLPFICWSQEPIKVDDCLQLKGIVKSNTKIYADPNSGSHDRGVAEKFSVLYMFKHETGSSSVYNGFYRVGKSADKAIGYIPEEQIVEWNHRLVLAFTDLVGSARNPALVYPTLKEAQLKDWDSNKKPNEKAIGQEPTSNKSEKYDMLLPVLEETTVGKKGRNRENMKAYKIGFLGETGDAGIKKPSYSGPSYLDLMFLIDATGSMAEEIQGAKQVVRSITNTLRSLDNTEVRIGISLYKDYGDDFVTRKWQSLTSDYSKVLSRISDIEVSAGGDIEEAMYQGVLTTINTANWKKGEQAPVLREILIIGDAPSHEYGGTYKVDKSDLITKASEERVRFIALKINTGSVAVDFKHEEQLSDMVDGLKDGDKGLYMEAKAYTGSMSDDYLNKLSEAIKSEIARIKELENVRSGVKRLDDVTPTNRAIFLKNLPSSGYEDIGVHFNQGWITEKNSNGLKQVEPFVYMTYGDLAKYKFVCQAAIAVAQSDASADSGIIDLTKDKLTALSGEDYDPEMELDEHLRKTLCLPSSDSGILKFSLSEIFRWSDLRKDKFILSIDDKVKVLDQILRDNSLWRSSDGSDLKYTFLKLELMP